MKRNNDSHKIKSLDVAGVGVLDIDEEEIKKVTESFHKPISLDKLEKIPTTLRVYSPKEKKIVPNKGILFTAAGPEGIAQSKLQLMSDPLDPTTRKDLTTCAISEPNLSSSIDRRTESLYEDGVDIVLELASKFNPATGKEYDETELKTILAEKSQSYLPHLARLNTWIDDMNIVEAMRDAEAVSFVQGRNATLMYPGIMDLQQGALPILVETIHADDLKEVIVDVGLTRKVVAVKTNLNGKKFVRADEMVYLVRGVKKALRREGKFYGISPIEPILIIAKILKRIYNYDASEAAVAAYVTQMLFEVMVDGNQQGLKERIEKLLAEFVKRGKKAFATFDEIKKITPVGVKVDWSMLDGIESKLAHLVLAITGVPSSMANREQNLNRDLAIVQAIQFIKFVRAPSEKLVSEAFAAQMITPLLAHLAGQTVNDLPVRAKIVRKAPEKDLDQIWGDSLTETKQDVINQTDAASQTSLFTAAGPNGIVVTTQEGQTYHVKPASKTD